MKILIGGYYGFRNTGDELILHKILEDVSRMQIPVEPLVWSGDVDYTKKIHGVDAVDRFSIDETVNAVKWADVVVVGGGGLIHEYFGAAVGALFENFGYGVSAYAILPFLAGVYGKPVFYWAHGVGPLFSDDAREFCRWFYSLAGCITVRDEYSYSLLRRLGIIGDNLYLDVDPAIYLDMRKISEKSSFVREKGKDRDGSRRIGVNIRPWFGEERFIETLGGALKAYLEKDKDAVVVPVPFDLNLDVGVLKKLLNMLPEDRIWDEHLERIESPFDVVALVGSVDYFIGTRLHSVIVSIGFAKPTFGIVYDKKVESAVRGFGVEHVYAHSDGVLFRNKIESFLFGGRSVKPELDRGYVAPKVFLEFVKGKQESETVKGKKSGVFVPVEEDLKLCESFVASLRFENEELSRRIEELERNNEKLGSKVSHLESLLEKSEKEKRELIEHFEGEIESLRDELKKIRKENGELLAEKDRLFKLLDEIYSSRLWKIARGYYKTKELIKRALGKSASEESETPSPESDENFLDYCRQLEMPESYNKFDILFFSIIDWDFRVQRPQHIALRFARDGHRVFYIKTSLKKGDRYSVRKVDRNIYEIELPYIEDLSIYSNDLSDGLGIPERAIAELIKKYSIKEHIYFVEFPTWVSLIKRIKDKYKQPLIFDVLDEFSGFENVHPETEAYENELLALSDAVIASSEKLCEKIKKRGIKCNLVKNGTDFEHFNRAKGKLADRPGGISSPVIGYYGAISNWFDEELIEYAAKSHPEWSFVLIGHTFGANIENLKKLKNVYFLGEKPYSELPKYLSWFDVCLIPFKNVSLIQSTNPVKFYEYISAGKPVVATRMSELLGFKDIVYLADDREDFVRKIEMALEERDEGIIEKRIKLARENDWDARYTKIRRIVKDSFPGVSIIVVTYNNLEYTKMCISSILEKTAYPSYKIIVVDNASDDGTRGYLEELGRRENISVVFNDSNLGFARANNVGIEKADGEFLILLNNDTIVTRGWIGGLLRHFHDSVGMVGPVTNSIGNEAKINVSYSDINDMDCFAEYYTAKHFGEEFEIGVLAMFCVAIKREVVDRVGLLDEGYGIGMFEDDDYAMAVKREGYKLVCAEDVFIHHFGGATFGKMDSKEFRELFDRNRRRFEEKWGVKWKPHRYREGVS